MHHPKRPLWQRILEPKGPGTAWFVLALFLVWLLLMISALAESSAQAPEPIPVTPSGTVRPPNPKATIPTTTTTTTTTLPPLPAVDPKTPCQEWLRTAVNVGWPQDVKTLEKLLRIVYRESRCNPLACSQTDSPHIRQCRDWGLAQINDYSWKRTVESQGLKMIDLWHPEHNLRFALWLYNYSLDRNGDGWQPWRLPAK